MEEFHPQISIVTPNFNLGRYLEHTIQSVLDQGYPNLEYIIIDGGSTDDSLRVIKRYEKHLNYWVSEPDSGLYDALLKGFARANGDIRGWINSDDLYYESAFATVSCIFQQLPDVQWITGAGSVANEFGHVVNVEPSRAWSRFHFYRGDYKFIQQESTFWRKELWQSVDATIMKRYKLAGDLALWSIFMDQTDLYTVNAPLGKFRRRTSGNSAYENMRLYEQEADQIMREFLSRISDQDMGGLKKINTRFALLDLIRRGRVFNHQAFKRKFVDPLMQCPKSIEFDRQRQLFFHR